MITPTKITNRDSCKTYALRRIGLSHLINWNDDTPTMFEIYNSEDFDHLNEPEIGCLMIWKSDLDKEKFIIEHEIDEFGRIINVSSHSYGHCRVYEGNGYTSEARMLIIDDRVVTKLFLRKFDELRKPDFILKYNGK